MGSRGQVVGLEEFITFNTFSGERGEKAERQVMLWRDLGELDSVFCGGWLKEPLMSSTFFAK